MRNFYGLTWHKLFPFISSGINIPTITINRRSFTNIFCHRHCLAFRHQILFCHTDSNEIDLGSPHRTWHRKHSKNSTILKSLFRRRYSQPLVTADCIEKLCEILQLKPKDCERVVSQPHFKNSSEQQVISSAYYLKDQGIGAEYVLKAPWILWQSKDKLEQKFAVLQSPYLFENVKDSVGFTLFDVDLIESYEMFFKTEKASYPEHRNKIYYIADVLKLPVSFFTIKLVHAWLVLHLSRTKLDSVINILLEFGVKPSDIVRDAWIFLHNTYVMERRLRRMVEVNNEPPKLWICRCPDFFFERYYTRCKTKGTYKTIHQLLVKLLDCEDEEKLKTVYRKGGFKISSLTVIAENINTLLEAGFSKEFIRSNPLLLRYSTRRTLSRMKVLQELEIEPLLYHFTISSGRFEEFLHAKTKKVAE